MDANLEPRIGMPVRVTVDGEPFPGLVAAVRDVKVIDAVYFKTFGGFPPGTELRRSPFAYFAYGIRKDMFTEPAHWSWP